MKDLDSEKILFNQTLIEFLEKIDKIQELKRIMNSIWTKIRSNNVISLDLSRLEIEVFDSTIFEHPALSNLQYLYLQGNHIENFQNSFFDNITSLKGLNLPNNRIEKVHRDTFSTLANLEWLNLSSNSLTELDDFAFRGLLNLSALSLSHNQIENINESNFEDLSKLKKLDLSNNSLGHLDSSEFKWLNNLEVLNLQSNKIERIGNGLPRFLPKLEKLYLRHNPGFTLQNKFENRYEIIEIFRSQSKIQMSDIAMTELLNFEDDQIIATFNQLIEDPRWDGGIGRVSNYKLSQVSGIPIHIISRKIETLITQKKLKNLVHFDNNDPISFEKHYWIRVLKSKGSINEGLNEPKCLWCNVELIDPFEPCANCGLRCEICKFAIKQSQEFDVCTSESEKACLEIFHRSEFMEWVRIYSSCPKCSQDINLNFYQVSQDYSKKVGAIVEQDMELSTGIGNHKNEFLIPLALSILINLKKVRTDITSSEEMIIQIGREAREQHQEVLKDLQPLATEIVLITAFLHRLESNAITEESFKASIDKIGERFDIFEENIDIIFEAHDKDKSKMRKIEEITLKGSLKGGEMGVRALAERSGLLGNIRQYVKFPTKGGLKSILGRIGKGIRDQTGDPTTWIKLASIFLIM